MTTFPPFLRFDEVQLEYDTGSQSLITKCQLFEGCLDSIKPALKDSNKICFAAKIDKDDSRHFSDHRNVVNYLRDRLLQICDSSRRYIFDIFLDLVEDSNTEFISSILQISQVRSCSNVSIELFGINVTARLPVEDISNWLVPKTDDGAEICGKKKQNLIIFSHVIPNAQEMWDHLKEVNFIWVLGSNRFRFCSFLFIHYILSFH